MSFNEISSTMVRNITVSLDNVAECNDAVLKVAGREHGRTVSAGLDGYVLGIALSRTHRFGGNMTGSEVATAHGVSNTFVSDGLAVGDVLAVIADGGTDRIAEYRTPLQVSKLTVWAENLRAVWADSQGAHTLGQFAGFAVDVHGDDADKRSVAIVGLYNVLGDVHAVKGAMRDGVPAGDDDGDDAGDDDDAPTAWQAMLANVLSVAISQGATVSEVLTIVDATFTA